MKLYYSPGSCSLSPHIVLHEAGLAHEIERVDLKSKQTEYGSDYTQENPKGSVPALKLDNGEVLTEGVVIVQYLADQSPASKLAPEAGTMARYRLQEMLNYIATDVHKSFGPLFNPRMPDEGKAIAKENLAKKYGYLNGVLEQKGPYLFGEQFSVADAYLYVTLRWAAKMDLGFDKMTGIKRFMDAMDAREGVQSALRTEENAQKAA